MMNSEFKFENAPVIILANPQMGENIGATARAMLNFGMTELRLIAPRDGWPNERAEAMSSGAFDMMAPVQVFSRTEDAIADLHMVYATTARERDMVKPAYSARQAASQIVDRVQSRQKTGIIFGGERAGLNNDDIALSHYIIQIPVNPNFSSLNLGQAVLLVCNEIFQSYRAAADIPIGNNNQLPRSIGEEELPAPHEELNGLYSRLENALDENNFFRSEDMKPAMMRNLKNMISRAELTGQEVRTFHGIISALNNKKSI